MTHDQIIQLLPAKWQIYAPLVLLAGMVAGRLYTAIVNGHGLVGIYRSIIFGSTTAAPKPPAAGDQLVTGPFVPKPAGPGDLTPPANDPKQTKSS